MKQMSGVSLAPGRGLGAVVRVTADVAAEDAGTPISLEEARERVRQVLSDREQSAQDGDTQDILQAYQVMLDDPSWNDLISAQIGQGMSPPEAVRRAARALAESLKAVDDPYLKARAQDVLDLGHMWAQALTSNGSTALPPLSQSSVVLTLTARVPDVLSWAEIPVAAIVVQEGHPTMHAALIARNAGIPMVQLTDLNRFEDGQRVLVDGDQGVVVIDPPEEAPPTAPSAETIRIGPVRLSESVTVAVYANVGSTAEVVRAQQFGADGVGLYRTEFLMEAQGRLLSRDEQIQAYREACQTQIGPITFRTVDFGSDKPLPGLTLPPEPNPALGQRGARLYAQYPQLFRDQVFALLAISADFPVSIMFPMISNLRDWETCRATVHQVTEELTAQGIVPKPQALGIMLEVPTVVFLVDQFCQRGVQFFSLGTNDLTQYLNASDRERPGLDPHHSPLAWARAIQYAIAQSRSFHVPVSVCGNLGQEPQWARLLVGLGVHSLSVPAPQIPKIKAALWPAQGQFDALAQRAQKLVEEARDDEFLEQLEQL